jgi:hypothetical protein
MMAEDSTAIPAVICDAVQERTGMTSAGRQARFRERQRQLGMIPVTVIVPAQTVADLQQIAAAMRAATHLVPGPLRDPLSGKLVSARHVLARDKSDR